MTPEEFDARLSRLEDWVIRMSCGSCRLTGGEACRVHPAGTLASLDVGPEPAAGDAS